MQNITEVVAQSLQTSRGEKSGAEWLRLLKAAYAVTIFQCKVSTEDEERLNATFDCADNNSSLAESLMSWYLDSSSPELYDALQALLQNINEIDFLYTRAES